MSVDTLAREGVSMEALLAAKAQRAARQADWIAHYQQPVVSLTLVTPGAVKDSIRYRNMMGVALQACDQMLWKHRWQTLDRQVLWLPTGLEALWCVAHPASEIKALCDELVRTHPLGRLWDIDVTSPKEGLVSVQSEEKHLRQCLLCDAPAQECARNHRHETEQLVAHVDRMIDAWFARD